MATIAVCICGPTNIAAPEVPGLVFGLIAVVLAAALPIACLKNNESSLYALAREMPFLSYRPLTNCRLKTEVRSALVCIERHLPSCVAICRIVLSHVFENACGRYGTRDYVELTRTPCVVTPCQTGIWRRGSSAANWPIRRLLRG
jgi:hypothetical protein